MDRRFGNMGNGRVLFGAPNPTLHRSGHAFSSFTYTNTRDNRNTACVCRGISPKTRCSYETLALDAFKEEELNLFRDVFRQRVEDTRCPGFAVSGDIRGDRRREFQRIPKSHLPRRQPYGPRPGTSQCAPLSPGQPR